MKKIAPWLTLLIPPIIWAIIAYWFGTNISLGFFEGSLFWSSLVIVELVISGIILYCQEIKIVPVVVIGVIVILLNVIGLAGGTMLFQSNNAYKQLGEVEESSFTDSIIPIDNTQIPTVDDDLALKQAEKKLGEEPGLGSIVDVGKFTLQQIDGKLTFVAPLEHSGMWKYFDNKTTPGYITVSATNPDDVQLFQELDGKEIKLRYLESACFGDKLLRHIRNSGYRTTGLTDMSFELDESGRPYWTVTTYENTAFWGLPEANGVLVCDAQTGECKLYSIDEAPEWIDKVQPEDFINEQIDNYGNYEKEFWNSIFGKNGVINKTPGLLTVYNNGECYYYTGMTSVGNDDATTGFMMVNTRTKEAKSFQMAGATEESAQASAEGKIQEKGYNATLPVPINVQGIPTYFMTLKDKSGLIKAYAMVNIENYSIVATGESIDQVQQAYIDAMLANGNDTVIGSDESYSYNVEGTVTRIFANISDGNTVYYMIINGDTTKLYVAVSKLSEELPITREGDHIKISYIDDSNGTVNVSKFDNLDFKQEKSKDQQKKDEQTTEEGVLEDDANKVYEVDPEKAQQEWNSLTDEEKAKLLEEQ